MIKRWIAQLFFNRIASAIEKAASSDEYVRYQYLCHALGDTTFRPFKAMSKKLVMQKLGGHLTLSCLIRKQLYYTHYDQSVIDWYERMPWVGKIDIHRVYWAKLVEQLRSGNPHWGKEFHPEEIGFPLASETLADYILNKLWKAESE